MGVGPDGSGSDILGVVLVGGESRRYGSPKALEEVYGVPLVERARRALDTRLRRVVAVGGVTGLSEATAMEARPDDTPGQGPMGGLVTALRWAAELELGGVFVIACDLPLLPASLVDLMLRRWSPDTDALIPESHGPRGYEPLCAIYSLRCLPVAEGLLTEGRRSLEKLLGRVRVGRIPLASIEAIVEPETAFLNVNTPGDRVRVEEILRASEKKPGGGD